VGSLESSKTSKRFLNVISKYNSLLVSHGGFFSHLNSATKRDALCVFAEPGANLGSMTLQMLILSTGTSLKSSATNYIAPRILVFVGQGTSLEVIEEYASLGSSQQFSNSVMECYLSEKSKLLHRYVQLESPQSVNYHIKSTQVDQKEGSHYKCLEIRIGSAISRHDLLVSQAGLNTDTDIKHFILAGENQSHDIRSKIQLDYPMAAVNHFHKSIVAQSTGRSLFDATIKVGREAEKTVANQLSRNLLLASRASLISRPKLQIIAEDVKCTHGCAVSDLDDHSMFYFASRGIGKQAARQALVYSFGLERITEIGHENLRMRVEHAVLNQLYKTRLSKDN
jgi:Fe-S cluster assembly protein SufD